MKSLLLVLGLCVAVHGKCEKTKRGSIPGYITPSYAVSGLGLGQDPKKVCHLDFSTTKGNVVPDISGFANNAFMTEGSILVNFKEGKCGSAAYAYCGDILFHGDTFQAKPREGITICAYINLKETCGSHSIFDTIGLSHQCGQYHFEVNNGAIRFFHRNESQMTVFSVTAEGNLVKPNKWSHVCGTYDSKTGKTFIFHNGKVRNMSIGAGLLSWDWNSRAGIGDHKAGRTLKGFIDDLQIYNYALNPAEINVLANKCGLVKPDNDTVPPTSLPPTTPMPLAADKAQNKKFADITQPILDHNAPDAVVASSDDFLPLKKQPRHNIDSIEEAVLKRDHIEH